MLRVVNEFYFFLFFRIFNIWWFYINDKDLYGGGRNYKYVL